MYKLTLIAAALVASQVAGAAEVFKDDTSSVNLYGRVYAGYNLGDDEGKSDNYGNDSYARIGAKAKAVINDKLNAIARYELQFGIADSEKQSATKTRLGYVGVDGDFGEVTFGRNYGSSYLLAGMTDVSYTNPYGGGGILYNKNDNIGRTSGLLKYAGEFSGVSVQAGYKFKHEEDADTDGTFDDNSAFGLAAAYTLDFGLTLGAAYNTQKQGENDDSTTTLVGVNYDAHGVYAALVYSMGENNPKKGYFEQTGIEAALGYKITKTFRAQVMYNKADGEKIEGASTTDLTDYFLVAARYDLSKNARLVAEYQVNNLDDMENVLTFAARYDF